MPNINLSASQIAFYANAAGFVGPARVTAVAVALAESGGNTWAVDNDADGSQDQGLWQINTVHSSQFPGMIRDPVSTPGSTTAIVGASTMFDPSVNARAAYRISGGGSNWTPWSTYNSGAYQRYVAQATSAALYGPFPGNPDNPGASLGDATPPASSVAGAPYILVDDHDVPIVATNPADQIAAQAVPSAIVGLVVAGIGDVGPYVTGGTVELDADQIGQITFTVQDPANTLGAKLTLDTDVTYRGMRFRIATKETTQGGGVGPQHQIEAQVRIAQQMKVTRNPPTMPSGVASSSGSDTLTDTPGNSVPPAQPGTPAGVGSSYSDGTQQPPLGQVAVAQNPNPGMSITPTDYIAYWVKKLGGSLYYGAPTYTQAVISPIPVMQGLPPDIYGENLYDVVSRLAANYGYWLFDADGTNVWFGPPGSGGIFNTAEQGQGIISRGVPFKVGWAGAWGDETFDAIDYPDCRKTTNDVLTPATVVVHLPRDRGEQVRPGMCMWLKGVPDFDNAGQGAPYVVTKVNWALDAGQTAATVTAVTPINPVPEDIALLPAPLPVTAGTGNGQIPYATQIPLSNSPALTHLVDDFVTFALQQQGKPYVWGAEGPSSFDCSGLVEWAAAQCGVTYPQPGFGGTRSQAQYETSAAAADSITVAQAAGERGALLFAGNEGSEHVAISLGDNRHTLEATHPGSTVQVIDNGNLSTIERRFSLGATIPGLDYHTHPGIVPINPDAPIVGPNGLNQYGGFGSGNYGPPLP